MRWLVIIVTGLIAVFSWWFAYYAFSNNSCGWYGPDYECPAIHPIADVIGWGMALASTFVFVKLANQSRHAKSAKPKMKEDV